MSKGLGFPGILDSIINKENNQIGQIENIKSNQLAHDLQSQEKFLQDQDTETGVSKDAMGKYPTFKGIPTILMYVLTSIAIGYGGYEGSKYILLNQIDKGPQQEKIVNDTQKNIQNDFQIDTAAIINNHKETLSADQLEDFEGFSKEKQREFAQDSVQ